MTESSSKIVDDGLLAFVRNIPPTFRSKNLRQFFSSFVETERFACFHFRHRPENDNQDNNSDATVESSTSKSSSSKSKKPGGQCCLIRIVGGTNDRKEFIRIYEGKNWTDDKDDILAARCRIHPARLGDDEPIPIELRPPVGTMPRGNVGTPTKYFLDSIKQCRLPASLIGKLGLKFPKSSGRRIYSNVPPPSTNRGDMRRDERDESEPMDDEEDDGGDRKVGDQDDDDDEDEPAEEWDRHEAQYDDVTEQDRAKERLYEEDMEVVWEKGGSGLVFYTDAYYWDQEETDTDAKWADDWDIDTNVYVDPTDADKDARDSVQIRREAMLRSGELVESMFRKRKPTESQLQLTNQRSRGDDRRPKKSRTADDGPSTSNFDGVGGFGRKVMEKHGWTPGTGLGSTIRGKLKPVHDELKDASRHGGFDKRGFGYFGEKLDRKPLAKPAQKRLINTVYDNPIAADPPERLLLRNETTWNKHR